MPKNDSAGNAIAMYAPTAAPPVTPSVYGVASGFLRIVWKVFPATASAAPVMNASSIRGRR